MKAGFSETARHLWHAAPLWRYSVQAAGAFTVLAGIHAFIDSGPSTSSYAPPPVPPAPVTAPALPLDPAVEARLADFEGAAAGIPKGLGEGEACERLAEAFNRLSRDDVTAGRNVVRSSTSRIRALTAGQKCHDDLAASDVRLGSLDRALSSRPGGQGDPCPAILAVYGRVTGFDRSRAAGSVTALSKAQPFVDACAASDERLAALADALAAMRLDQGPAAYQRTADALRLLTDPDRTRASGDQKAVIAAAEQAAGEVGRSRARITRLPGLLAAEAAGHDPDAASRLLAAVSEITPFDEKLASPAETATIAEARKRTATIAWAMLKDRLASLSGDPTEAHYKSIGPLYQAAQRDSSVRTPEQDALLRAAEAAMNFLAASDTRLRQLLDAATAWHDRSFGAKGEVTAAFQSITEFDQKRFDNAHTQAWSDLSRADRIIRGPVLGLSNAPVNRTPIYVFTTSGASDNQHFVDRLNGALRDAGYQIATARRDASLLIRVSVSRVSQPQMDTSDGPVARFTAAAEVEVDAWWASDDSRLFDGTVPGSSTRDDYVTARTGALDNAVENTVSGLKQQAVR